MFLYWSAYHKNDDRWNCRKLSFQKYNVHRTTAQKYRTNFKTRQSLHTTTQLLQGSSEAGAKICSYYTLDKAYTLQHSYYKAPLKVEPKFGHFIHRIKPTHYNTATPRLKWSWSQKLVILYTRQSLHTTTQLLQGSSEAGAKICSYYTLDKAYTLQHSYYKAPLKVEPKFGHFIHRIKPTHYNTATPRL